MLLKYYALSKVLPSCSRKCNDNTSHNIPRIKSPEQLLLYLLFKSALHLYLRCFPVNGKSYMINLHSQKTFKVLPDIVRHKK